ncbi:hypothetical protein C8Q70DRAFT_1059397 [Cubamyces menziesii]|nr:hypothetical protein C8Q70DRAFT_1059397 [Cubamyces menziesii]
MSLLFCPMPFLYAAIRMDPVAMVEHLQDPIALAAARKLQPKTYLVYIEAQLELPFPGKPWYRFCVCPIGTSLRPEDKVHDLTPEMCIAIHPNKFHPTGRSPVIPEPSFPYDNCYHWIGFAIYIRVRARSEQFEHERAVRLPPEERTTMELHWEDDDDRRDVASDGSSSGCSEPGDAVSILSRAATSTSSSESSIEPDTGDTAGDILAEMNIFGDPMHDVELFPLVDLWFELTEHLKQEDIPDPMELYKERDEIVRGSSLKS